MESVASLEIAEVVESISFVAFVVILVVYPTQTVNAKSRSDIWYLGTETHGRPR